MCGISGVIAKNIPNPDREFTFAVWESIFEASLRRGSDASGVIAVSGNRVLTYKHNRNFGSLLKDQAYLDLKSEIRKNDSLSIMGQSRLATNGSASDNSNNQPFSKDGISIVHNGIVVNDYELRSKYNINLDYELDTKTILELLIQFGIKFNPEIAIKRLFGEIKGNSSIAVIIEERNSCVIASNNGSLYHFNDESLGYFVFASESRFIHDSLRKSGVKIEVDDIKQLITNSFVEIELGTFRSSHERMEFFSNILPTNEPLGRDVDKRKFNYKEFTQRDIPNFHELVRCTNCILPSTFPSIVFDEEGKCNYCNEVVNFSIPIKGTNKLLDALKVSENEDRGKPIVVGVSGGRDSCYGLYYLKEVLGLNVIAFTYDWGMVTDLARRNIARVCGKLGVEHVIVAPRTHVKLRNVRLNLQAWCKKPNLGIIPLMMAGDKQFYSFGRKLQKERSSPSFVLCAGNRYEITNFKTSFAGVNQKGNSGVLRDVSRLQSISMLGYYLKAFVRNPKYLNSSLVDTFSAFVSSYFLPEDYVYLFNYIDWDEDVILKLLREEFEWEDATDTKTTWRIGDGTAPFYNYVYYSVAGFTESDTFRSNQIRAGVLNRARAMEIVEFENLPRMQALSWYAQRVGISIDEIVMATQSMKKLWS